MARKSKNQKRLTDARAGYLFVSPSAILLFAFIILPIFISVVLSFTKFNGMSTPEWIGFANYKEILKSKDFQSAMKNVLEYVLITVPLQTILSLLLAAVLASKFRNPFGETVRGTLFIPVLCSSALVGSIFYYLFSSDSEATINMLISMFGFAKVNWLGQRSTVLPVICLVDVWKNTGYFLVVFYAGIMDVPKPLYEAARMDGATSFQQFWHITIPGIRSVLNLVVTLGTIWAFQVFDIVFVMTKGGPGKATTTPVLQIYNSAFMNYRLGYASAAACILSIVIFAVTMLLRWVSREKAGED